ncbi:MAG: 16S rRNA (guanine(527)-N(7))-methyltransferase RsmG [Caldisericia bacterium]|nr:16S rRNA (guanine(527)-N(7))-methyltransferase RsmG [Caldisericia bacterium]
MNDLLKKDLDIEKYIKLNRYSELLLNSPKKIPIMCELNLDKIYKKYIEESFYYIDYINDGEKVLDLGSGAGFPGIPLSIILENSDFYLIDRKQNVCKFLNYIKENLNLNNVYILNLRAEELKKEKLKFNKVVARAFNRINYILDLIDEIIYKNGLVILGKGRNLDNEINSQINKNFMLYKKIKTYFGYIVVYKKIN